MKVIPKLPYIYDEPFGDSSAIPTYLVSKLARTKVKVSLSADGGDEQFCGYTRYWMVGKRINKLKKIPFLNLWAKVLDLFSPDFALKIYQFFSPFLPKWYNFRDKYIKLRNVLKAKDLKEQYDISNKIFLNGDLIELILLWKNLGNQDLINSNLFKLEKNIWGKLDDLSLMMYYDLKSYLPDDILVKVDRATMSVALEGREPLLDHKLIEFTCKLPIEMKYQKGVNKYLLKKVLSKYLPRELWDRPKMGFGVPIYEWFKGDLKDLYKEYLEPKRIKKDGIFNYHEVERLLKGYFENKGVNHNKLWLLLIFELWKEYWGN